MADDFSAGPGEFVSPSIDGPGNGGVYLLEPGEGVDDYEDPRIPAQQYSNVRMREKRQPQARNAQGGRENFQGGRENFQGGRGEEQYQRGVFADYRRDMPTSSTLRSNQATRRAIDAADWDGRPRGFRDDDGPRASAFTPPASLRPPRGGVWTSTMMSHRIPYSEAIDRPPDPNSTNLLPCVGCSKEGFAAAGARNDSPPIVDPATAGAAPQIVDQKTVKVIARTLSSGLQVMKAILLFVIVAMVAAMFAATMQIKGQVKEMRQQLRDLMALG